MLTVAGESAKAGRPGEVVFYDPAARALGEDASGLSLGIIFTNHSHDIRFSFGVHARLTDSIRSMLKAPSRGPAC